MEWIFFLVTSFIFSLIFIAPLSATIAKSKGLKKVYWFLAGLFLGPLGLFAVCGMPDKNLSRKLTELIRKQDDLLNSISYQSPSKTLPKISDSQEKEE
tara:strand:+ start:841 stop:1134 length:294 start_codon:yes stop_codon:yes gene_type:complete